MGSPQAVLRPWLLVGFALSYACVIGAELGLATLVVLAHRRSRLYLPLAIIAHFTVDRDLRRSITSNTQETPL